LQKQPPDARGNWLTVGCVTLVTAREFIECGLRGVQPLKRLKAVAIKSSAHTLCESSMLSWMRLNLTATPAGECAGISAIRYSSALLWAPKRLNPSSDRLGAALKASMERIELAFQGQ